MKPKLLVLSLAAGLLTACNEPPMLTYPYWTYRQHAATFNDLRKTVDRNITAAPVEQQIHGMTESVIRTVEAMEQELLRKAGQADPRLGKYDPPVMDKLLDHSIPSAILIGQEPGKPSTAPLSAEALKAQIDTHLSIVAQLCGTDGVFFQTLLPTGDAVDGSGTLSHWSTATFYQMPLIHTLDELNTIKVRLKQIEHVAIGLSRKQAAQAAPAAP